MILKMVCVRARSYEKRARKAHQERAICRAWTLSRHQMAFCFWRLVHELFS